MNKKIITLILLLIALVSILSIYTYIKQTSTYKKEFKSDIETIDDKILSEEIDNSFIDEDKEIEIGDMI